MVGGMQDDFCAVRVQQSAWTQLLFVSSAVRQRPNYLIAVPSRYNLRRPQTTDRRPRTEESGSDLLNLRRAQS